MYYKVKVYSAEDSTKRNDFFVKENLPYVADKYIFTNDGFGHWNLCRLIGTHKELVKERLYC